MRCAQPDSEPDNVLIEWTLIAELQQCGSLHFVLPVMIGLVTPDMLQGNGSFVTNFFSEDMISKLPDIVCTKVVSRVAELLQVRNREKISMKNRRTVN